MILPLVSIEPILVHSVTDPGPDHLVIKTQAPTSDGIEEFHQFLLDVIASDWPIGWNSITDQYCDEGLQRFRTIALILTVSQQSDALALAMTPQCCSAVADFHGSNFVRVTLLGEI